MDGIVAGPGVITFRLPSPPPSMNSLYSIHYGKRKIFMKPEVRQYKTTMKLYVPKWDVKDGEKVEAEFEVVDSWFFKNGSFRKLDVQNVLKVLLDLIAEKQGWDDSQVWRFVATKRHDESSKCVNVTLRKIVDDSGAAKSAAQKHQEHQKHGQ